jgi:hypothetical protein
MPPAPMQAADLHPNDPDPNDPGSEKIVIASENQ